MSQRRTVACRRWREVVATSEYGGLAATIDKPDVRWCWDEFEITFDSGERGHIAVTLDCCDRVAISWVATTVDIDSGAIRDLMIENVEGRLVIIRSIWHDGTTSPPTKAADPISRVHLAV